jgi:hypothetical protein
MVFISRKEAYKMSIAGLRTAATAGDAAEPRPPLPPRDGQMALAANASDDIFF